MVIGEALNAARRMDPSLTDDMPTLPEWVGLRNVLIHIYSDVNPGIIWKTFSSEVPELIGTLERMLAADGTNGDTPAG